MLLQDIILGSKFQFFFSKLAKFQKKKFKIATKFFLKKSKIFLIEKNNSIFYGANSDRLISLSDQSMELIPGLPGLVMLEVRNFA